MQEHSTCESQHYLSTYSVPSMISPPLTASGVTDFCYSENAQELGQHDSEKTASTLPYLTATQMLKDYLCNTLLHIKFLARHLRAPYFQGSPKWIITLNDLKVRVMWHTSFSGMKVSECPSWGSRKAWVRKWKKILKRLLLKKRGQWKSKLITQNSNSAISWLQKVDFTAYKPASAW